MHLIVKKENEILIVEQLVEILNTKDAVIIPDAYIVTKTPKVILESQKNLFSRSHWLIEENYIA